LHPSTGEIYPPSLGGGIKLYELARMADQVSSMWLRLTDFCFQESGHAFVDVSGSFMLSPDEGTWQHLKQVELRNVCCFDLNHLHQQLDLAILRLRHKPYLIRSFFDRAGLYL